jgi:hypothetical protein
VSTDPFRSMFEGSAGLDSTLNGGDRRAVKPGTGRAMADAGPRPPLRRLRDLRAGKAFVCRLTRARGIVLGRDEHDGFGIEVQLTAPGKGPQVRRLAPEILVEVA